MNHSHKYLGLKKNFKKILKNLKEKLLVGKLPVLTNTLNLHFL